MAATLTSSGNHASKPGRNQSDEYNIVVDDRSVGERIARGDLTRSLTAKNGGHGRAGIDLDDAESNWLVPSVSPPLLSTTDGGQRTTDVECGAFPVRPPDVAGGLTRRYGKGTDSDATDALVIDRGGVREGAGSAPRGGRRVVEAGGDEPDAERLRGRVGEGLDAGDGAADVGEGEHGRRGEDAERGLGTEPRGSDGPDAVDAGSGAPAHPDGMREAAGLPGRLDPRATSEVAQTLTVHNTAKSTGQAPDEKDYIVVPHAAGDVEHFALRGREGGVAIEATDLPNVRAHTGKDGGGHDHLIHDQRVAHETGAGWWTEDEAAGTLRANGGGGDPKQVVFEDGERAEAFLPRHYTRGKDGAPDDVVPPMTKESDRGDGMALVHTYNVQPAHMDPDENGVRNGLEARVTDHAEALTASMGRRSDRGTVAQVPCIHPDAIDRTGDSVTAGADATGHVRRRPAGLGVIDDGTSYTLNTGPPPAVLASGVAEGAVCPNDLLPDGARFAAMGDAVTVNVIEWIGLRLRVALEDEPPTPVSVGG